MFGKPKAATLAIDEEIAERREGVPWMVGGDFNVFAIEEERKGTIPCGRNRRIDMLEFAETISDYQLMDPGSDGAQFTWARGTIFERLDRVLLGKGWPSSFPSTRVTNLPRVGSDHGPLLVRCNSDRSTTRSSFRFQNMWVRHSSLVAEVKKVWEEQTELRGMRRLHLKLMKANERLKAWNRETFGNIFANIRNTELRAAEAQTNFEEDQSPENICANNHAMAHLLLTLKMEEDFWRQKAAIKWVAEGERNTKYYQGWVRQKSVKARIHEIREGENTISDEGELRVSAANFFQKLLAEGEAELEEPDLDLIQPIPPGVDMNLLGSTPTQFEVRKTVFNIAADGAPGPDGFTALFYQSCWDCVGEDVTADVEEFFGGAYMPRSFTATMIVLLPKKDRPTTWANFRPISICNVSNKIISKILASRLAPIMPMVTSPNQSGFVKGRLLSDNVLLAQEMIQYLSRGYPSPNIAIKLDMA